MRGAGEPAEPRQPGLVVDGQALGQPGGRVEVRKEQRIATEDVLRDAPPAAGAIEVEDVGQLVLDDERVPVAVESQRLDVDRWVGVEQDPIRRERGGWSQFVKSTLSVRTTSIGPRGGCQPAREGRIGALGVDRGAAGLIPGAAA